MGSRWLVTFCSFPSVRICQIHIFEKICAAGIIVDVLSLLAKRTSIFRFNFFSFSKINPHFNHVLFPLSPLYLRGLFSINIKSRRICTFSLFYSPQTTRNLCSLLNPSNPTQYYLFNKKEN